MAVAVFRYGARILQWKEIGLEDLDRKSKETMTMYGTLQLKSDVDRFYLKRKYGGRGLMSCECSVKEEENSLVFYVANSEENLIRGVAAAEKISTEDTVMSGEFKKQKTQELKKTGMKSKCKDSLSGKCQIKLIRVKLGNGYPKVI